MQFKKIENIYVISIGRGEEIIKTLLDFCEKNKIRLGCFSGIGAVNKAELAHYSVETKKYSTKIIEKPLEILNLTGNITAMGGKCYVHAHITLSDDKMNAVGGHLKSAVVSAACEIFLVKTDSEVGRVFDKNIGLNMLKF
ncbi:DNA-binding protein [Candidatus Woesearchaeota archaeon]|nr:DNA-binding protein [Candidatus Woesearchaeota archaeon]MBI2130339.1 DNA-binding protein [Candidatus Woesearchaeota archaeon]